MQGFLKNDLPEKLFEGNKFRQECFESFIKKTWRIDKEERVAILMNLILIKYGDSENYDEIFSDENLMIIKAAKEDENYYLSFLSSATPIMLIFLPFFISDNIDSIYSCAGAVVFFLISSCILKHAKKIAIAFCYTYFEKLFEKRIKN